MEAKPETHIILTADKAYGGLDELPTPLGRIAVLWYDALPPGMTYIVERRMMDRPKAIKEIAADLAAADG